MSLSGAEARASRAGLALVHDLAENWEEPSKAEKSARSRKAPEYDAWLGRSRAPARAASIETELLDTVRAGEGFDDQSVLEFAYLALRAEVAYETAKSRPESDFFSEDAVMQEPSTMVLGVAEVCARLGLKRMQLKRLRDAGKFPKPVAELAAGPIWKETDLP